jgi:uncharacterized protein (TIGR02452 family)
MMAYNYRNINFEVMSDTEHCYITNTELVNAVQNSIANQFMVAEEENIDQPISKTTHTRYIVSGKRSFEAAKDYAGKNIAVLNYANNLSIGGAPFYAGAQEESLCRCSTLLPCLQAMKEPFYQKHHHQYITNQMNFMGNDDLIYTPDVVVFKSDERTDPVYPRMMERKDWFKVNVITCAAPQMQIAKTYPHNYESVIYSRIKKILDVAEKEGNKVIILGAWGCGAFKNSIEIVARAFVDLLKNYNFEIVEFALATKNDIRSSAFARMLQEINNK